MNCRDVRVLIPAYLDEEVTLSEKKLIQAHLAECPDCQQELEVIGALRNRIRQNLKARAATVTPSPQAWTHLQASLPSRPPKISAFEKAIRSFSLPGWMMIGKLSPQKIVGALLFVIVLFACAPPVWERVEPLITDLFRIGRVTIAAQIDGSAELYSGTFEVSEGADVFGCERGTFVDSDYIYHRGPSAVLREFTCELGERSGTFTFALALYRPGQGWGTPGPWSVDKTTGEFFGLSGDGSWEIAYDEDEPGVMTLIGKFQYTPFSGVLGMRASGESLWAWNDKEIWRYTDNEWSRYAESPSWDLRDVEYNLGSLMVIARKGLQYFDGYEWQIVPGSPQDLNYIEMDDQSGIMWAMDGNLYRWDGKEWTSIMLPFLGPPPGEFGGDIVVTGDGILWTSDMNFYFPQLGGVARYDEASGNWEMVRPWRLDEDVPAQVMATTPHGDLWMILVDWADDWHEHQDEDKSYVDWVLAHRDVSTGKWTIIDEGLPGGIPSVMVANDDAVWMAQGMGGSTPWHDGVDGLFRFDGEAWTHYLPGAAIRHIAIAPDGTIWYKAFEDDTVRQHR
jgi:hypothetical protein